MANIKTVKLSNGSVYSIFDTGALRLNDDGVLVTGNTIVDSIIINKGLKIAEIDSIPVGTAIDNVMVAQNVGTTEDPVYQVKKRTTEELLKDIGGASYSMNNTTNVLTLKLGK